MWLSQEMEVKEGEVTFPRSWTPLQLWSKVCPPTIPQNHVEQLGQSWEHVQAQSLHPLVPPFPHLYERDNNAFLRELLWVVQVGILVIGRQYDCGSIDTASQTATSSFVAPGLYQSFVIMIFQHNNSLLSPIYSFLFDGWPCKSNENYVNGHQTLCFLTLKPVVSTP